MVGMKKQILVWLFSILLALGAAGCDSEEKKDTFSGYGKLVTERDQARRRVAGKRNVVKEGSDRKSDKGSRAGRPPGGTREKKKRSSGDGDRNTKWQYRTSDKKSNNYTSVENVVILSRDRKRVLGSGLVYLDERGRIIGVRIR